MGTSTHMGIWKVVLDICSPSKHWKGILAGENRGGKAWRGMEESRMKKKEERGMEEYLNRIVEELFLPQSRFNTTYLHCILSIKCVNGTMLDLLSCAFLFCKLCLMKFYRIIECLCITYVTEFNDVPFFTMISFSTGDNMLSVMDTTDWALRRVPVNEFVLGLFSPWFPPLLTWLWATLCIIGVHSKGNQKKRNIMDWECGVRRVECGSCILLHYYYICVVDLFRTCWHIKRLLLWFRFFI